MLCGVALHPEESSEVSRLLDGDGRTPTDGRERRERDVAPRDAVLRVLPVETDDGVFFVHESVVGSPRRPADGNDNVDEAARGGTVIVSRRLSVSTSEEFRSKLLYECRDPSGHISCLKCLAEMRRKRDNRTGATAKHVGE